MAVSLILDTFSGSKPVESAPVSSFWARSMLEENCLSCELLRGRWGWAVTSHLRFPGVVNIRHFCIVGAGSIVWI